MPRGRPKKVRVEVDALDATFEAITGGKAVTVLEDAPNEVATVAATSLVLPADLPGSDIEVVNFIAAAALGHAAEASHSVYARKWIAGEYLKSIRFDNDPRFIRVESAGDSVDLIPLTNVASIHLRRSAK